MQDDTPCETLLIGSLNRIEHALARLARSKDTDQLQEALAACRGDLKLCLRSARTSQQVCEDMQAEIDRLVLQKEHITLEMLIFQRDYHQLQQKIDYYKGRPLEESIMTFVTQSISSSPNNTLNRAFVADQEDSFNQFLTCEQPSPVVDSALRERFKINSAMKIVSSQSQPFERKHQAWLGIIYSKNAEDQSKIFYEDAIPKSLSSRSSLQFSGISVTEGYEVKPKLLRQDMQFSGKKIKSMIFLKEKSGKKKSVPKTSVKKEMENNRQHENAEAEEDKMMRKKLHFVNKAHERQGKVVEKQNITNKKQMRKRQPRITEVHTTKSNKKPLIS